MSVSILEGVLDVEGSGFEEVAAELVEVVAEDCAGGGSRVSSREVR